MELLRPLDSTNFPARSISYTGTAGVTGTWNAGPQGVMVWSTTDAYVSVGEGVTATSSDTPLPAYTPIVINVPNGTGAPWRVSALQIASGGTVYAKPVNKE